MPPGSRLPPDLWISPLLGQPKGHSSAPSATDAARAEPAGAADQEVAGTPVQRPHCGQGEQVAAPKGLGLSMPLPGRRASKRAAGPAVNASLERLPDPAPALAVRTDSAGQVAGASRQWQLPGTHAEPGQQRAQPQPVAWHLAATLGSDAADGTGDGSGCALQSHGDAAATPWLGQTGQRQTPPLVDGIGEGTGVPQLQQQRPGAPMSAGLEQPTQQARQIPLGERRVKQHTCCQNPWQCHTTTMQACI